MGSRNKMFLRLTKSKRKKSFLVKQFLKVYGNLVLKIQILLHKVLSSLQVIILPSQLTLRPSMKTDQLQKGIIITSSSPFLSQSGVLTWFRELRLRGQTGNSWLLFHLFIAGTGFITNFQPWPS